MTETHPAVRIVLADDHELVLDGLRALVATSPDLRIVAATSDGVRALDAVRRLTPDVLVMDLQMPQLGGLACLRAIRAERLPVRVLILSAFGDAHTLRGSIDEGADGFALKTDSPHATLAAIRQVASGHLVFPQAARRWLGRGTARGPSDAGHNELTSREESVLMLVAEGRSNADIASALHLSESTVKFHMRNLFAKLGVANRTEAATKYHRRGPEPTG